MQGKIIVDSNIWVYLYSTNEIRSLKAKKLIEENFSSILLTSQILGEIYNVLVKKGFKTKSQAFEIIEELISSFTVLEVDVLKVLKAIEINNRYDYSYWDSLIISSALLGECETVYSEDMQDGQIIENTLRLVNPLK